MKRSFTAPASNRHAPRRRTRAVRAALLLLTLSLLLLPLSACKTATPDDRAHAGLTFADSAFTADVRGTLCRTVSDGYEGPAGLPGAGRTGVPWDIAASVTVSAPDAAGNRTVSVTYTAPASLAGLTVTRAYQVPEAASAAPGAPSAPGEPTTTLTLGTLTFTDSSGAYDALLFPALSLIPSGDIRSKDTAPDGLRTVTLAHPLGAADDPAASWEQTFSFADAPLPVRVVLTTPERVIDLAVSPHA